MDLRSGGRGWGPWGGRGGHREVGCMFVCLFVKKDSTDHAQKYTTTLPLCEPLDRFRTCDVLRWQLYYLVRSVAFFLTFTRLSVSQRSTASRAV